MTKCWKPFPVSKAADMFRFGKVRDARDKELRDPDNVFIHAEERRRELAKQRKKR